MLRYGNQLQRPRPGARPDLTGLGSGLMFLAPGWDADGSTVQEVVAENNLTIASAPWVTATGGIGINLNATTAASGAAQPSYLNLALPFTAVVAIQKTGIFPAGARLFSAANSSGVLAWGIATSGAGIRMYFPIGGSNSTVTFSVTLVTGQDYVVAISYTAATVTGYCCSQGQLIATQASAETVTASTAGALHLGFGGVGTANGSAPNAIVYWGALWNRLLSSAEVGQLSSVPAIGRLFPAAWGPEQFYPYLGGTRYPSVQRPVSSRFDVRQWN